MLEADQGLSSPEKMVSVLHKPNGLYLLHLNEGNLPKERNVLLWRPPLGRLVGCGVAPLGPAWLRAVSIILLRSPCRMCRVLREPGRPPAPRVLAAWRGCGMPGPPFLGSGRPPASRWSRCGERTARAPLQGLQAARPPPSSCRPVLKQARPRCCGNASQLALQRGPSLQPPRPRCPPSTCAAPLPLARLLGLLQPPGPGAGVSSTFRGEEGGAASEDGQLTPERATQ